MYALNVYRMYINPFPVCVRLEKSFIIQSYYLANHLDLNLLDKPPPCNWFLGLP